MDPAIVLELPRLQVGALLNQPEQLMTVSRPDANAGVAAPLSASSAHASAARPETRWPTFALLTASERLSVLFVGEALVLYIVQLPKTLSFSLFGFRDQGANLVRDYLLAFGYRPVVDFGHPYGLLGLLVGHIWFLAAGRTPVAYQAAMLAVDLLMAWAMARFAVNLGLSTSAIVFMMAAMPFAIAPSYFAFAQALEAVLLCNALAEQAKGRYATALALAAGALFAKPAMAYVYGLLIVIIITAGCFRTREWARELIARARPATIAGLSLFALLALTYGPALALYSLIPTRGVEIYRALHFGFFRGEGSLLWYYPGVSPGYYLGTVAGFYLVGTAFLIAVAGYSLYRGVRGAGVHALLSGPRAQLVLTCAILQLAFLALMFGNAGSWRYYSYVLVMGVAATEFIVGRADLWVMVFVALLGNKMNLLTACETWKSAIRSPTVAGLWAAPAMVREWSHVTALAQGRRAVVLSSAGAASLLTPGFEPPVAIFLEPVVSAPGEIARAAAQLRDAQLIVAPVIPGFIDWPFRIQSLADAVKTHRLAWQGEYFRVYELGERPPLTRSAPHRSQPANGSEPAA